MILRNFFKNSSVLVGTGFPYQLKKIARKLQGIGLKDNLLIQAREEGHLPELSAVPETQVNH